MKVFIQGGMVVIGDGGLLKRGSVVFRDRRILEVTEKNIKPPSEAEVIDASGRIVMPGIINNHAHGIIFGAPLFGTGSAALSDEQTLANLDRHLLEGTTTILNVDGFATMEQVKRTRAQHPLRIQTSTIHTPLNIKAAYSSDGEGMKSDNERLTVKRMLEVGAVAIAEVGDGGTLGGGGQDYIFIPQAVKEATGVMLSTTQARAIKLAVLGAHIDPPQFDENRVLALLKKYNLKGKIDVLGIKALIEDTVLPPFQIAVDGMIEGGQYAQRHGVPIIVHHAAASLNTVRKLAYLGRLLVAGHSNHPSFELEECIRANRYLKEQGVIIDVSTLDSFGAQEVADSPKNMYALIEEGIADIISTDYGAGKHDALTVCLDNLVTQGICTLEKAVAMMTGNVATLLPSLAPERGILRKGNIADITIVNQSNISEVSRVIVGGQTVVKDGLLTY